MRRSAAAAGTATFFVVAPGTVVGVIPWLISRWELAGFGPLWRAAQAVGILLIVLLGQALLFGSAGVLLYAAFVWMATASFIRWYEEPTLARQYGGHYDEYRRHVPAWLPRWRPWMPASGPAA